MKISLIENGLDSLRKGYSSLNKYNNLLINEAKDAQRYSALKDAVLSIQHGVEILFKYLLLQENEILLYSEINQKLKNAYKKKRDGEISELFESDGVHTVTYKESIERVTDICGIPIEDKLKRKLLQIEKWRNSITHSAILLDEQEVSSILSNIMPDLDLFFGPQIGDEYLHGQGRMELDRAYSYFKEISDENKNPLKLKVVQRLIEALKENDIKNITSPGVFMVTDAGKAISILQRMQGDDINYGFDMINMHCSGDSLISKPNNGLFCISSRDNNAEYFLKFSAAVIYVPPINNDFSPLIFIFGDTALPITSNPMISEFNGAETQRGFRFIDEDEEIWDRDECQSFISNEADHRTYASLFKFLSAGCICFLNVQTLSYGRAKDILYSRHYKQADALFRDLHSQINSEQD